MKQKDIQREMQIKNMDEAFRLRIETTPYHRHSLCHHTNPDRNWPSKVGIGPNRPTQQRLAAAISARSTRRTSAFQAHS